MGCSTWGLRFISAEVRDMIGDVTSMLLLVPCRPW